MLAAFRAEQFSPLAKLRRHGCCSPARWNDATTRAGHSPAGKEQAMSKLIGFATLAGATCLMIGSALAQGQTPPAQTPAEKDVRSDSSPGRPIPPIRPPVPQA